MHCGVDSLQCLLLDGTSCPKTLCPNSTVIYLCSLPPRISQQGVSRWSLGTIIGNCPNGVIDLRQPIATNDCIVNQTTTCGPYNGSLLIPCAVTTLTVMVTQSLNGTIIQCQNFNDLNYNTEILGSTTIVVSGYRSAPVSPNIYVKKNLNALSVAWVPSSIGDPAISFAVHIQGHGTNQVVTVDEGTNYKLYFSGLESNTLYSITVTAINCAGSNKVNTTVYTC